jgi:hypothetical protein
MLIEVLIMIQLQLVLIRRSTFSSVLERLLVD